MFLTIPGDADASHWWLGGYAFRSVAVRNLLVFIQSTLLVGVSLLGWLGAFCEASPGRATHPRPAVRPGNGDGERKANPHPKSHPERTLPPSRKCEALGPCPDPLVHPIPPSSPATSQQSQPSRAQPLRHEPVPSEQRDPGHTPGPAFSQEAASRTRPRGTRSSSELLA